VRRRETVEPEDALPVPRQMINRRAAESAETHDDGVEREGHAKNLIKADSLIQNPL